jgi:hypothetical protein
MEDKVEIAKALCELNSRRGIVHVLTNQILSSGVVSEAGSGLIDKINLQSRAYYTFISHLCDWYIGVEEGERAINFKIPFRANPWLAVTYEPGREEERQQKYFEEATIIEESEMADCFHGSRWKILPPEDPNELFADSLPSESAFYVGHLLSTAMWAAYQKPKEAYAKLIDEFIRETESIHPFIKDEKYVRAILEKQPVRLKNFGKK